MAGQTALGSWITNTFAPPAGPLAKAMSGSQTPDPNKGLTPEEIAARKKKLMAAGQSQGPMSSFGDSVMALLGSHR
jgi:hypothetical protein